MKRWSFLFLLPLTVILVYFYGSIKENTSIEAAEEVPKKEHSYQVDAVPFAKDVNRIGINLSNNNPSKSEPLSQNILMNPGFEGNIDRIIAIVTQSDQNSFSDDKGWGYPDDYWKDAEYEVRSGKYSGTRGTISHSLQEGAQGFPQYFTEKSLPSFENKDAIVLTKTIFGNKIPHWMVPEELGDFVSIDSSEHRPGSSGSHALLLQPTEQPLLIKTRPGKLAQLQGEWKFTFWLKGEENQEVSIDFKRRHQADSFLSKTIKPTPFWKKYTFNFTPNEVESTKPLTLKIQVSGKGKLWIDDLWLGAAGDSSSEFRQEVLTALKEIRPSYIRELPSVGDSMENRVADPSARKSWINHKAGSSGEDTYSYSLLEFLNLCKSVDANPWIIVPPTFSDQEYRQLGKFLLENAPANIFSTVILEFGKENWNWTYRPTGIPYPKTHGSLADRAYEFILLGANGATHFIKTVNGQYLDPALSIEYLENTKTAEALAIAPYFFPALDADISDQKALQNLFQNDSGMMEQTALGVKNLDKKLSIYEMNLNTLEGTASEAQRTRFVAGSASGTALAKRVLEAMQAGANPIMIYSLIQFEADTWDNKEKVKLWGIVRSLSPTLRFRPTGLAVVMLNKICGGDAYKIENNGGPLTMLAFTPQEKWTAAIASSSETPITAELTFPDDNKPLPLTMLTLDSQSPFTTNEDEDLVKLKPATIQINDRTASFTVPPYGFVILGSEAQTASTKKEVKEVAASESKEKIFKRRLEEFRQKRKALEKGIKG